MGSENLYAIVSVDEYSITPKYQQLINSIVKAVQEGKLSLDYVLPSINDLSFELELSRKTVEKAYAQLKNLGIVNSIPGKGYFISRSNLRKVTKVFLLFNKL